MPVGNDDNAPNLAVFPVTPTVQGDTEVDGAVPGLTLSKYSHSGGVSLPSSAGLGRDICLTKVLGSVLITLPDHCVHVCGGGCVRQEIRELFYLPLLTEHQVSCLN